MKHLDRNTCQVANSPSRILAHLRICACDQPHISHETFLHFHLFLSHNFFVRVSYLSPHPSIVVFITKKKKKPNKKLETIQTYVNFSKMDNESWLVSFQVENRREGRHWDRGERGWEIWRKEKSPHLLILLCDATTHPMAKGDRVEGENHTGVVGIPFFPLSLFFYLYFKRRLWQPRNRQETHRNGHGEGDW